MEAHLILVLALHGAVAEICRKFVLWVFLSSRHAYLQDSHLCTFPAGATREAVLPPAGHQSCQGRPA